MTGEGDDEEIVTGTEGEGAEGQDAPERDEDSEVPAEHADQEEDDGEQVDAQPEKPQSREQRRNQKLANERNAERQRAERLEQELQEARREARQRQQFESEEQRQARRALMTPEERITDDMQAMERRFTATRQQDQMNTAAMMDKAAYDAKAASNGVYAKYRDAVEAKFQEQLRKGQPVEREILLKYLLGERALSGASDTKPRKAAKGRVESQRVAPASGKGDAPSNRGKAGDTAENRLKDVYI